MSLPYKASVWSCRELSNRLTVASEGVGRDSPLNSSGISHWLKPILGFVTSAYYQELLNSSEVTYWTPCLTTKTVSSPKDVFDVLKYFSSGRPRSDRVTVHITTIKPHCPILMLIRIFKLPKSQWKLDAMIYDFQELGIVIMFLVFISTECSFAYCSVELLLQTDIS